MKRARCAEGKFKDGTVITISRPKAAIIENWTGPSKPWLGQVRTWMPRRDGGDPSDDSLGRDRHSDSRKPYSPHYDSFENAYGSSG